MKKLVYAFTAVLSIALAAYCGYAIGAFSIDVLGAGLETIIPVYILLLFLSVIFADFAHEGAHFLVGLFCGMDVTMPKIRLFKSSSLTVCPKNANHVKAKMIATASAGLIINFACAAVGAMALFLPRIPVFFSILLPYSFYLFVVNAVPLEYDSGKTDGLVIWELISNADSAKVMLVILKVQGMMRSGTNLADVPETLLLEVPQLPEDDINFIILTQLRYEYYLARGNDSEAYKYFLRYKDLIQYLPSEYKEKNK